MSTQPQPLSDGYNRVEDSQTTYHNPETGVVIDVWERKHGGLIQDYPYVVAAAKQQQKRYMGVFKTRENAEQKAIELTHSIE